ncbi:MAG: FHA domain-containing protein [Clostridium sp.]|nr:FHA domain-containing protein [Bacteroides sp.]MCM1198480.1 FHA domain-containing protein [Clostridium sp.]
MKKNIILPFALMFYTMLSFAQKDGCIERGFDVGHFPDVTFVYHSYNPDLLDSSSFWSLEEAGEECAFSVRNIPDNHEDEMQTTLFLWEDMAYNGYAQYDFTRKTISGFMEDAAIPETDRFAVCVFNRRKNTASLLMPLTDVFTSDRNSVINAVRCHGMSVEPYMDFPNRSDLYEAIKEGLDFLAPVNGVKSIVVFTAGRPMKNSGANSEAQVLLKAQQLHIPVYIFQYYYQSGVATESSEFAKSTFGLFRSYMDADEAKGELLSLYPQIKERYHGQRYEISFRSNSARRGESHVVSLTVNGVEVQEQMLIPQHTFKTWCIAHPFALACIVLVLVAAIVLSIIFILKTRKAAYENRRGLEELENKRILDKESAEQWQKEMIGKARREKDEKERAAEYDRLLALMKNKNLYPRLKCQVAESVFTYVVCEPLTRIGRDRDNTLVLDDGTVSRHHAEIVFDGNSFEIVDKGSTNKIIVNGQFVERTVLRSGDIIGLGETLITFI